MRRATPARSQGEGREGEREAREAEIALEEHLRDMERAIDEEIEFRIREMERGIDREIEHHIEESIKGDRERRRTERL